MMKVDAVVVVAVSVASSTHADGQWARTLF